MENTGKKPSVLGEWIIRKVTLEEEIISLLGDLREIYRSISQNESRLKAYLWFWFQVLISLPQFFKYSFQKGLDMIKNYLKIIVRDIRRHRGYSFINILGLIVGTGSFLLIMQYVNFELSYDKFHGNIARIYRVENDRIYPDRIDKSAGCPPAVGPTLKSEFPEVLESAKIYPVQNNIIMPVENNAPVRSRGSVEYSTEKIYFAEDSFLRIFSFPFISGTPENALSEPNTAVLSESMAQKYFGSENPMGKTIAVTNDYGRQTYKITGVVQDVPENSHIKFGCLFSFKTFISIDSRAEYLWYWNAYNTYLLLVPGTDAKILEKKFETIVQKYHTDENINREYLLQPVKSIHLHSNLRFEPEVNGDVRSVYFLTVIALFILVIAWVNYINLSTARSMMRAKEIGIRKVLGSRRVQLFKQFIFESFFLVCVTTGIALMAVLFLLPFLSRLIGKTVYPELSIGTIVITVLSVVVGTLICGIYPSLTLSSVKPANILRSKRGITFKGINIRRTLVIFQFIMSVALIITAFIVYRQLNFMKTRDLGIAIDRTLVLKIPRIRDNYLDYKNRFVNELESYSNIKSITTSSVIPGREIGMVASGIRPVTSNPEDGKQCYVVYVDYDYFTAFQIEFLSRRNFSRDFGTDREAVIVNQEILDIFNMGNPDNALTNQMILEQLGLGTRNIRLFRFFS